MQILLFYKVRNFWVSVEVTSFQFIHEIFNMLVQFEMAKDFLKPTFGGTIIDASCASGLFSRLFVKSELYSLVIALDYSENMLRQCYEFTNQDNISKEYGILFSATWLSFLFGEDSLTQMAS